MDATQLEKVRTGQGFFAALDQSGGSTPKALAEYGIDEDRYSSEDEMFDLVHRMRTRVITDTAFGGDRVLAAILFEQTMDREMGGVPTGHYLWDEKQVVPFLKIDKGLADEADGVQLMKAIDTLDELLVRAVDHRMFGTKMRSVIKDAEAGGVTAIADQQFELGRPHRRRRARADPRARGRHPQPAQGAGRGFAARRAMRTHRRPARRRDDHAQAHHSDAAGRYADLAADPRVLRVLALSGGYSRDEACDLLARDHSMIASFSRALLAGLSDGQTDAEFHRDPRPLDRADLPRLQ